MFTSRIIGAALAISLASALAFAQSREISVGTPVSPQELAKYFAVQPGGAGLPSGRGTRDKGRELYVERCAHCHGEKLEGIHEAAGPALIGGRGTLTSDKPLQTVESYWPYASTLYDYIWRAMPFDNPGSLTTDEVYSLVSYILNEGNVIKSEELDAESLSKVVMPNVDNFYQSLGPDLRIYRSSDVKGGGK
ncbi:MAG: cytochrome c [Hyphomicrobium sp.]|nr:cytochrome c [Hyphomicrobium sp.]